jgi:hypothetical protein
MRKPREAEMRGRCAWIALAAGLLAATLWCLPALAQGVEGIQPADSRYRPLGIAIDRLSGGTEGGSATKRIVTESFDFRGFREVAASHSFRVNIVRSDSFEVLVRMDRSLQPYLVVEKRGETLFLRLEPARILDSHQATLEAEVRMPDLRGIRASGASDISIQGFSSSGSFQAELSGASVLEGETTAKSVRIEASGASTVRLRGEARQLRLDASGASSLDLRGFPAEDAEIELSGASEAEVVLSGLLHIQASGASRLYLGGSPDIGRIDLSGASTIQRR